MFKKSNTVQKILFLLVIFLVIAGDALFNAMGIWNSADIVLGLIIVCFIGIFLFRGK